MGEHCTHDPIHSDTGPKYDTGMFGMDTNSSIYIHFPTFLRYHIHLPWRADIEINLDDYGWKEINKTDILDAWLRLYLLISPYDHPDGIVDW